MGKTSKPITILLDPHLADLPEIKALAEKGHTLLRLGDPLTPAQWAAVDLIWSAKAWRLTPDLVSKAGIEVALRGARDLRYPKPATGNAGRRPATDKTGADTAKGEPHDDTTGTATMDR
jgi:hypothetical protein